jgi:hypothetical protein
MVRRAVYCMIKVAEAHDPCGVFRSAYLSRTIVA